MSVVITRYRLRESMGALRLGSAGSTQPAYIRLSEGTVIEIVGAPRDSGLMDVMVGDSAVTVFAEDLLRRAEPVASGRAAEA